MSYFCSFRAYLRRYLIVGCYAISDDRCYSVDDIAAHLGVKRDTIYKWIERKGMPVHKVGRLWKFRKGEIDHWVINGSTEKDETERIT